MPQMEWCNDCHKYVDPNDKPVKPAHEDIRYDDPDGSKIGMGMTVVRRCPAGHMLNIGTANGFHGSLTPRR